MAAVHYRREKWAKSRPGPAQGEAAGHSAAVMPKEECGLFDGTASYDANQSLAISRVKLKLRSCWSNGLGFRLRKLAGLTVWGSKRGVE